MHSALLLYTLNAHCLATNLLISRWAIAVYEYCIVLVGSFVTIVDQIHPIYLRSTLYSVDSCNRPLVKRGSRKRARHGADGACRSKLPFYELSVSNENHCYSLAVLIHYILFHLPLGIHHEVNEASMLLNDTTANYCARGYTHLPYRDRSARWVLRTRLR